MIGSALTRPTQEGKGMVTRGSQGLVKGIQPQSDVLPAQTVCLGEERDDKHHLTKLYGAAEVQLRAQSAQPNFAQNFSAFEFPSCVRIPEVW
jgi:hypothetical protein